MRLEIQQKKWIEIASEVGKALDLSTQITGGCESAIAIGRIAFKTGIDMAWGDTVCTAMGAVSGACEKIAIGCFTIKIPPFRGRIYVCVKIVSKSCMTYRNLCVGKDC